MTTSRRTAVSKNIRTQDQKSLAEVEEDLAVPFGQVEAAADILPKIVDRLKKRSDLGELALAYATLRRMKEAIEASQKKISKLVEHMNYTVLPEAFERAGQTMIRTAPDSTGTAYTVSATSFARATARDKQAAFEWLRQNGFEDIVTETVNANTLASLAKELQADGRDLPDTVFKVEFGVKTSLRKAR